jgi:patatin-like phospholipase/acyl hydrolase
MENLKRIESVNIQSDNLINLKPEEIDRSLLCAICQEILKIPRECTNCHNNFCKKCIDIWLAQKNDSCPFRCPDKIKLVKSHKIILDALRILKFKCKNEIYGCNFLMNYDNYIQHTQKCEFNLISCPNQSCKTNLLSKDIEKHLSTECEFHVHKCSVCSFEYIGVNKVPHVCAKIAIKHFNELKSEIDNFMMKVTNRINNINEKMMEIN